MRWSIDLLIVKMMIVCIRLRVNMMIDGNEIDANDYYYLYDFVMYEWMDV